MITLKDVAKHAGVSEATASLVLNKKGKVRKETRARVLAAAEVLGYSPNLLARSLATKKASTIGLVITDIENPFFGSLTRYVDEFITAMGYSFILSVSNNDLSLEEKIINDFVSKRVDGLIVVPCLPIRTDFSSFRRLEKLRIPFLFSTSYYPGYECDFVMTDLKAGALRITKYLLELGHRSIIELAASDLAAMPSKLRIDGYLQAYEEMGIPVSPQNIIECGQADFHSGYVATKDLLIRGKPDAIIAINDILALGAQKAVRERGLDIPGDISIAGYDDVVFSSISDIPLTTVRQDIRRIARESVNVLMKRIGGSSENRIQLTITSELIVRMSSGVCRSSGGNPT